MYLARTIVTGQRDETRLPGFGRCLVDVLKKVSGDPDITSEEVATAAGPALDYVKGFSDCDRMEGIPIHDDTDGLFTYTERYGVRHTLCKSENQYRKT